MKKYNLSREGIAMVGDRLATDVMLGKNARLTTVLVFSGATSRDEYEASEIKADFIFNSVNEILF